MLGQMPWDQGSAAGCSSLPIPAWGTLMSAHHEGLLLPLSPEHHFPFSRH